MTTQDGGNESSYHPPPIAQIVTHLCINSKGPWDNTTKILSIIEDVEELDENQLKKNKAIDYGGGGSGSGTSLPTPKEEVKLYDTMPTNLEEFINDIVPY